MFRGTEPKLVVYQAFQHQFKAEFDSVNVEYNDNKPYFDVFQEWAAIFNLVVSHEAAYPTSRVSKSSHAIYCLSFLMRNVAVSQVY
jgi:hypothetical protein